MSAFHKSTPVPGIPHNSIQSQIFSLLPRPPANSVPAQEDSSICVIRFASSPSRSATRDLLHRASQGGLTVEDWHLLQTRAEEKLLEIEKAMFNDATCLYTTQDEVSTINLEALKKLNQPCARIEARNVGGPDTKKATAEEANGLEPFVVLSKGAKVMLTRNLWQQQGQCSQFHNKTRDSPRTRTSKRNIEDVVWPQGATRSELILLRAVLVSCKTYAGPTMWKTEPRPGFPDGIPIVPIPCVKTSYDYKGKTVYRTQLPLWLAWAVTIHKSQGLTIPKIKLGLGKKEFATGLTFVGLSRVKALSDVMIVGPLVDYARVRNLGGRKLQERIRDWNRRYIQQQI